MKILSHAGCARAFNGKNEYYFVTGYEGIIEDVVLIGAPVGVCSEEWEALEAVISGTLYNCYSR